MKDIKFDLRDISVIPAIVSRPDAARDARPGNLPGAESRQQDDADPGDRRESPGLEGFLRPE